MHSYTQEEAQLTSKFHKSITRFGSPAVRHSRQPTNLVEQL